MQLVIIKLDENLKIERLWIEACICLRYDEIKTNSDKAVSLNCCPLGRNVEKNEEAGQLLENLPRGIAWDTL